MGTGRINKATVEKLLCPEGRDRVFLWDATIPGFGVVAFKSGRKAYVVQYRFAGRTRRRYFGTVGRLTPEEARTEAKRLLGRVELGFDPIHEEKNARAVPLFKELASEFLRVHVGAKRKQRTFKEYQRLLELQIIPAFGNHRVVDIRRSDVTRLHSYVSKRAPIAANRCVAIISSMWGWAARRDLVSFESNPARGIERNPEPPRERYLNSEELARLERALTLREGRQTPDPANDDENGMMSSDASSEDKALDPFAVAAVRLLILTGARLNEVLRLRWEDIDFDRGLLNLPDSKTGRRTLQLSEAAVQLLASLPRLEDNPHVIPGLRAGSHRADLNRPWRKIKQAAGLPNVRIHDLRHTFASFAAGASLSLPLIGRLLGHKNVSTTARYAHLDAGPVRRAADQVGHDLDTAMSGTVAGRRLDK